MSVGELVGLLTVAALCALMIYALLRGEEL